MATRWFVCILLSLAGMAHASVTFAWKIPIASFAPDYARREDVHRLEKPPADSAFFQADDVLWDLSSWVSKRSGSIALSGEKAPTVPEAALPVPAWTGDWVVWNERSGMVVARGSYNDVFLVEEALGFLRMPTAIRTKFELMTKDPAGGRSVTVLGPASENASAKEQGLEVEATAEDWSFSGTVDDQLCISWPAGTSDDRWAVQTALTLPQGKRTLLAGHGSGANRWQLFATATVESLAGVPVSETRWIEHPGGLKPWPRTAEHDDEIRNRSEGNHLCVYRDPDLWSKLGSGPDPVPAAPSIKAPESVAEWMRGSVADVSEWVFDGAKGDRSGWFAGYDSRSHRLVVLADAFGQDHSEARVNSVLVDPLCGPQLWIESDPESGGWLLACRSGENAWMTHSNSGTNSSLKVGISEVGRKVFDLEFSMDILSGSKSLGRIVSSTEYALKDPEAVASHSFDSGTGDRKVTMTMRRTPP